MSEFEITKATREDAPITAAIIGQSGSGKTYSALLLARGLVGPKGKIVCIDTEGRRALIYADDKAIGGFEHLDFKAPFSSDRYREAMKTAIDFGADAIVIDSASHEWEQGVLEFAEQEEARIGNKRGVAIQKWVKPKMAHRLFLNYAIAVPSHVIFCYRENVSTDPNQKDDSGKLAELIKPISGKLDKFEFLFSVRLDPQNPGKVIEFEKNLPKPMAGLISVGDVIGVEIGKNLTGQTKGNPARPKSNVDDQHAELKSQVMELAADNDYSDEELLAVLKTAGFKGESWQQAPAKTLDWILKHPEKIAEKIETIRK